MQLSTVVSLCAHIYILYVEFVRMPLLNFKLSAANLPGPRFDSGRSTESPHAHESHMYAADAGLSGPWPPCPLRLPRRRRAAACSLTQPSLGSGGRKSAARRLERKSSTSPSVLRGRSLAAARRLHNAVWASIGHGGLSGQPPQLAPGINGGGGGAMGTTVAAPPVQVSHMADSASRSARSRASSH